MVANDPSRNKHFFPSVCVCVCLSSPSSIASFLLIWHRIFFLHIVTIELKSKRQYYCNPYKCHHNIYAIIITVKPANNENSSTAVEIWNCPRYANISMFLIWCPLFPCLYCIITYSADVLLGNAIFSYNEEVF